MIKICSDAGHGGSDPGAIGGGFAEKWGALSIDKAFSDEMSKHAKVIRTRTNDTFVGLSERSRIANANRVDVFVSHHLNAYNGVAEGLEVLYSSQEGKKIAKFVLDELWKTGLFKKNRGLKHRPGLAVLRGTAMPAILVEYGFVDNDAERARIYPNFDKLGITCANGIKKYLRSIGHNINIDPTPTKPKPQPKPSIPNYTIISNARGTIQQMQDWAKSKKANKLFVDLAPIFYKESVKAGIDPVLVYAQSAKETGYMNFGGVLDASYKNPCGLKTSSGGGDYDKNAHTKFKTWDDGISAQVDHLALYAGQKGYPNPNTKDPRHFASIKGTAKNVNDLGGKWAPSKTYGEEIAKMMLEIINIPIKTDPDKPSDWAKEAWDFVESKKLMSGNPKGNLTRQEFAMVLYRIFDK